VSFRSCHASVAFDCTLKCFARGVVFVVRATCTILAWIIGLMGSDMFAGAQLRSRRQDQCDDQGHDPP
jgi:hypothetical protein